MSVNEKTWPVKGNSAIGDRLELEVQVCESSLSLLSYLMDEAPLNADFSYSITQAFLSTCASTCKHP